MPAGKQEKSHEGRDSPVVTQMALESPDPKVSAPENSDISIYKASIGEVPPGHRED